MPKTKARQKSSAPTRKMWVQALASLVVTLAAGALASYGGVEVGGEVRSMLEVLAASGIAALLPLVPSWLTPPAPRDGVKDYYSGRSL